MSVYLTEFTS